MSVVAALEFNDEVPLRHPSCQPYRAHRGFRTARHKADLLNKWNCPRNQASQFQFEFRRHAEARAAPRLLRKRFADCRIRMPQDNRSPRAHVIKQLVPVRIVKILPASAFDDQRFAAYGLERPHRTVHAADQYLFGALENLARTLALALQPGLRCAHVFSIKLARLQPPCDILGVVGKNDFRTGPLDARQNLQYNSLLV